MREDEGALQGRVESLQRRVDLSLGALLDEGLGVLDKDIAPKQDKQWLEKLAWARDGCITYSWKYQKA